MNYKLGKITINGLKVAKVIFDKVVWHYCCNSLVIESSLLIKKKLHLSFYFKILYALILASIFLATAMIASYYCYFYTDLNKTSYILVLACSRVKVLYIYRVVA